MPKMKVKIDVNIEAIEYDPGVEADDIIEEIGTEFYIASSNMESDLKGLYGTDVEIDIDINI